MHVPLLLLALAHPIPQSTAFRDVHVAEGQARIAFAHVVTEFPTPRIGIFSETARLATWPEGPDGSESPPLQPSERYVLSPRFNTLGVVFHLYPCLEGIGSSLLAELTELRLPFGLPNGLPATEPLPPPPQPLQVSKSAWVRLSESGNLVAFLDAGHHPDEPGRVQLFRRLDMSSSQFIAAGGFAYDRGGDLQLSADGTVIAHANGAELRLFDSGAKERARVPLRGAFVLSPDGRWLARWMAGRLMLSELNASLAAPFPERTLDVSQVPLATVFAGNHVLVVTSARASLFSLQDNSLAWSRESENGTFSSADLMTPGPGRLLIALGELDVLSPHTRRSAGRAMVRASLFELADDAFLMQTEFTVTDWVADHPHLRLLGNPARLLVVTAERVQLSEPIP